MRFKGRCVTLRVTFAVVLPFRLIDVFRYNTEMVELSVAFFTVVLVSTCHK